MEELIVFFQKLCRTSNIRTVLVSGMLASLIIMFHTFSLPPRKSLPSLLPAGQDDATSYATVSRLSLLYNPVNASSEDPKEQDEGTQYEGFDDLNMVDDDIPDDDGDAGISGERDVDVTDVTNVTTISTTSPRTDAENKSASSWISQISSIPAAYNTSVLQSVPRMKKRAVPPTSIPEMTNLLMRNYAAYHSMRPRWTSPRDRELLAIRAQLENAPIVRHDEQLHAPAFRNLSRFKRSYQLMERTLKVYVYSDGKKPVFHLPILKGIYASEGWFMKLMEGSRRFVVRDPRRAHLFYMPFSSRHLQFAAYVRGSHNRTTLRVFLQKYVDSIASKYPFWNRTDGSDHFLVACHDWAPYATRHVMARSFKGLCNADLANGFKLGRDVSLPETYVRSAREPQRDMGGPPVEQRRLLAFYAGNLHGYLRPILLHHWENKDPEMMILGPMPPGVQSKMTYIGHMKNSKFCLCPRGYEVNSPRIVEAFFYECVPVIISDDYVPPFFEVLDWSAFSVFVAEKEVPRLKEILAGIPEEKYRALQLGVRRVQQHFLWHSVPVKYDLFHMILHSIWYNRVMNVKPR